MKNVNAKCIAILSLCIAYTGLLAQEAIPASGGNATAAMYLLLIPKYK
jgi:hypothetical protein